MKHVNRQLDKGMSYKEAVKSYVDKKRTQASVAAAVATTIAGAATIYIASGAAKKHMSAGSQWLKKNLKGAAFTAKNRIKYGSNVRMLK